VAQRSLSSGLYRRSGNLTLSGTSCFADLHKSEYRRWGIAPRPKTSFLEKIVAYFVSSSSAYSAYENTRSLRGLRRASSAAIFSAEEKTYRRILRFILASSLPYENTAALYLLRRASSAAIFSAETKTVRRILRFILASSLPYENTAALCLLRRASSAAIFSAETKTVRRILRFILASRALKLGLQTILHRNNIFSKLYYSFLPLSIESVPLSQLFVVLCLIRAKKYKIIISIVTRFLLSFC